MHKLQVAIIGRPNVGKSTLFNRLTGKKHALVDDMPGVTIDWREGEGRIGPLHFKILDTAGIENKPQNILFSKIKEITMQVVNQADVILFVIDSQVGVTDEDLQLAKVIRKTSKNIILVANKSESSKTNIYVQDFYKLGFGEPVFISAEHGLGMVDLFDVLNKIETENEGQDLKTKPEEIISLAIIGRPNAGKSTLINKLLNTERLVTADLPGTTHDSIAVEYIYQNQHFRLIDTAGIKKKTSIKNQMEEKTYEDSKRAIRFANVVILLIDATIAFESQDIAIANFAIKEGRPLVIAINKWDKISNKSQYNNALHDSISELLPELKDAPIIYVAAINGHNLDILMKAAISTYNNWNIRIPTAKLNMWLKEKVSSHPLPLSSEGKQVKIKYITQHTTRPPSFVLFSNRPESIIQSYIRYLTNSLKKDFELYGAPVRIHAKKLNNPYDK